MPEHGIGLHTIYGVSARRFEDDSFKIDCAFVLEKEVSIY
jgi:hypothetical protein